MVDQTTYIVPDEYKSLVDAHVNRSKPPVEMVGIEERYELGNQFEIGLVEEANEQLIDPNAGGFFDMLGVFNQTPSQNSYVKELIEQNQIADPNAFREKFGGINQENPQVLAEINKVELKGFNQAQYDALGEDASATEIEAARRNRVLEATGHFKDGNLEIEGNPLTLGQRFDLKRADNDETRLAMLKNIFGDTATLQSVEVGTDRKGNVASELIFSPGDGEKSYRLDPYGSFKGMKSFFNDLALSMRGNEEEADAADTRVREAMRAMGADVGNEVLSAEMLLPILATILPPVAGAGALVTGAVWGGKAIAAGGLNVLGQKFDDWVSNVPVEMTEGIDWGSAAFDTLLQSASGPAFSAFQWMAGNGSPLARFLEQKNAKVVRAALQAAEDLGVEGAQLPRAVMLNTGGLSRAFLARVSGLAQDVNAFKDSMKPLSRQVYAALQRKADQVGGLEKLTYKQIIQLQNTSNDRAVELIRLAGISTGEPSALARGAVIELGEVFLNMKARRNFFYDEALRSPQVQKAVYDGLNLDELKRLSKMGERKVQARVEPTPGEEVGVDDGILGLEAKAWKGGSEGAAEEVISINPPSQSLSTFYERIQKLANFKDSVKDPETGRVSSVMEQIHALKQNASELSDSMGSDNPFIRDIQNELDNLLTKAGDSIEVSGGKTAKEAYDLATAVSREEARLRSSDRIFRALSNGNTEPFQNLVEPLLSGKVGTSIDDLEVLTTVLEGEWSKTGSSPLRKQLEKYFPEGQEVKTAAQAIQAFRTQFSAASEAYLSRDPTSLGHKLKQMAGVESLGETDRILNNPAVMFTFKTKKRREAALQAAQQIEKNEHRQQIFREVYNELLGTDASSQEVSAVLVQKMEKIWTEHGATQPGGTVKIFDNIVKELGAEAAVPEFQRNLIEGILKKIRQGGGPKELPGVNADKVITEYAEGLSEFERKLADYSVSKDSTLTGLQDIPKLVEDLVTVSKVLEGFGGQDFGSSLATSESAGKLLGGKKVSTLISLAYRMFENKVLVSALLRPMSSKQIRETLDRANFMSSEERKRIISQVLVREKVRLSEENPVSLVGMPGPVGSYFVEQNEKNLLKMLAPSVRNKAARELAVRLKEVGYPAALTTTGGSQSDLGGGQAEDTLEVMPTRPPQIQRILSTPSAPAPLSSLNIPATNPVPGGIASLAGLEKVGLGLWT